ncbi:cytoplasmic dynein 2 heavy chain 1 isoform X1 [Trypanosoma conorhini]|uniref:Cytoplasmic dynein 2 heavy chain 1 isoform X1 n=1 Tax=Trypanosoma conorhini TaxID=83891 RepID=A0A422PJY9_9TRYP|nr:cytoplasmic dynein 2 heavy chain 1 isoform X1 [Trypanosoma conorhini]RNF18023.1 cytoplasmic dynein 2 heavy chain 1 isoform X1 [Trypanosoma conorhini]
MWRAGLVAVESQLFSVAQRHLQVIFGAAHVSRVDDCVVFEFSPLAEDEEDRLGGEVQRLFTALVREVTGRTSLRFAGEDDETDVTSLKEHAVSFSKFMADVVEVDALPGALESLPSQPQVCEMLEMLYADVVGDVEKGARLVTRFPKLMCPTGTRWDILLAKSVCIQVYSKSEKKLVPDSMEAVMNDSIISASMSVTTRLPQGPLMKVWMDLRVLADAISSYSTAPIESELPSQWRMKSFTLLEAPEVLHLVHDSLCFYWNHNPRNERTKVNATSLLYIVSGELREYIKGQILLESSDWRGPWRMNLEHLEKALALIKQWKKTTQTLLKEEWAGWDGGRFHDETLENFSVRLRDVVQIRQLLASASKLLQGKVESTTAPEVIFEEESLTDSRRTSDERWAECREKFEKEFSFLEDNLRGRVRQLFASQQQASAIPMRLLQQHHTLLRREGIRSGIAKELEEVRDLLIQQVEKVRGRYENKKLRATTDLQTLRLLQSCQAECAEVPETAAKLFGPSEHLEKVLESARALMQETQGTEQEVLASWKQTMEVQCKKAMDLPDAFVISGVGKDYIVCTLHASVKQLLQEFHNMRSWLGGGEGSNTKAAGAEKNTDGRRRSSKGDNNSSSSRNSNATQRRTNSHNGAPCDMGSLLSEEVMRTINLCERLMSAATRAMQIVGNYNTVQRQMLRCTRPILDAASTHVRTQVFYGGTESRVIPLANYHELEGINMRFQNAVEALSNDNRGIRRFHCDFISQVIALHNVDLARHMDQWRSAVDGMRTSFVEFLHTHHFGSHNAWRRHLDAQIYKALEHQYQRGLETLHEKMDELKVELVFKQGQVHFKPTFEAMREAYYVKLREFVSVPLRFRGLQEKRESGGPYEMYEIMPLVNKDRLVTVHLKALELFSKLTRLRKAFQAHMVIGACGVNGAPDIDTVVEEVCKTLPQFVDGFRIIKEQAQKLQYIENTMKVDCFTVSTIPAKASMEEQLHRLEESLLNAMRKKINKSLVDVDDFVFNASNIITRQPTTMDEVGQANKAYYEFVETMPSYQAKFTEVEELNRVLRQQSGTAIDLSATKSRWEHLSEAMASHHKIIDASVSKMRVSLDSMIQKHLKDGQRFTNKWEKQKQQLIVAFKENKMELINKTLSTLKDESQELGELKAQGSDLESKCEYFKLPPPNFYQFNLTVEDVTETAAMWKLYENFREDLLVLRKEDWLTFRSHIYAFEDFIKGWQGKLAAGEIAKTDGSVSGVIVDYLGALLQEWSTLLPLLRFVRGEGMMTEHWNEMFRLLGIEKGMKSADLTFGDILDHYKQIIAKEAELKQLHARAQGEVQIRDALQDLRAWALEAVFALMTPTDSSIPEKVKLITEWKETLTQVSDNQALINSLKDSPFFPHFADEVSGWEVKLATLAEALALMNTIQRKWTYLEPVFARGALPQEQPRFRRVDKEFVAIMREVEADPRVMSIGSQTDIVDRLRSILEQVERCQKSLIEFLEAKRESFPRFYFISDEDMLEILGHSKNPSVIQAHLKKLFMGIHFVVFSEDEKAITHMVSADKEEVQLAEQISIADDDDVEKWLSRLDAQMRETLRGLLIECVRVEDVAAPAVMDVFPSQLLQVAQQVQFTTAVQEAIESGTLAMLAKALRSKLTRLTEVTRGENQVLTLKVKSLILDVIHSIEIVDLLHAKGVRSLDSWWWQKQLRYYMADGSRCVVSMMDTKFLYTYEYQGNAPKLVHTPLTDKCYLVLTKGMGLGYGGNPYGPAGTGKTESVKALGSALGRQVLVFNCDEGIDFKAMGRIFIGIVTCGAWGCFDEFNRLKIDQLSALSQMIQVIQEALKNREPTCTLLHRSIQVNENAGIFVTLNPKGKGYGGRTKLPDNLKQLFREVAMSAPDNELITSTMLFSEGFTHAKLLSKKIVELYRLCGQLMTKQQHYDWGLRSLKAVLCLAGSLMHTWKRENQGKDSSEEEETELILQSLNTNTLSKLTEDDANLFRGITADMFPGVASREITYGELQSAIEEAVQRLRLQLIPAQVSKVLQLHEALKQRMGVVLVGPSGSGKSTLLRILRKALQLLHFEVPLYVMNPKAVPRHRLLGHMDPDTREWYDGVLSAAAREVVKCPKEHRPWILCDGDIDPEWVESLNSVLDDNKLLTLPNGVRIQFGNNVNFIFETHSLAYASPATVSRMGVILFSAKDISLECAVESFLEKQTPECRETLGPLIKKYVIPAVEKALELGALILPTTPLGMINCCLAHVLHAINEEDFVLTLIRGLCGMLHPQGSQQISATLYELSQLSPISSKRPFDTFYDRERKRLAEFSADLRVDVAPEALLSTEAVINTTDVQRLLATLEPLVDDSHCRPFFLVGSEGCGKSIILQRCFLRYPGIKTTVLHCSALTTSVHLIQKLEQLCTLSSTNTGHVYRPKEGERLVVIMKNVNLPKPDKYGTVELHAFLLQLIMYHGFYNSELEWIGVEKIQFVASMNPTTSAGRYEVSPRLLASVCIVSMSYPSRAGLIQIYTAYFSLLLKRTAIDGGAGCNDGSSLAQFVINVFERIRRRFEGEEYAYCLFSPRSITNCVTNLMMYAIDAQTTTLPAALAHECMCIFADCLSRTDDRRRAEKIISDVLATIGYSMPPKEERNPIMFVSWFSEVDERGVKPLRGVPYEMIAAEVGQALAKYGREFRELNVHVIPEALAWITRIDRVLARPVGHLILVGRPGVGRRGAVHLASYMLCMQVVTLNMIQGYSVKNFRNDIRQFVQRATTQNERLVLLLDEHNIVDESFLEMINSLVSSGDIPGLFTPEELETMFTSLREDASSDGYIGTIYSYFLMRLRRNLRLALVMDSHYPLFLVRLQSNPGLLSNCDLLWMGTWSNDATRTICKKRLKGIIKLIEAEPANKGFHLPQELFAVHETFGHEATPGRFQVFMETYKKILLNKSQNSGADLKRLETGLAKLHDAEANVEGIRRGVTRKKEEVEAMQREADNALTEIQKKMEESKEQRDNAQELQERLKEEHEEIVVKRQKVEDELSGIKPSLEAAREAVSSIRSEQLNEIRSLKAPPEPVRDVLEGVLALLGVTDVSWQSMRKFLGERGAKERILDFDTGKVTSAIRENVGRLLHQKATSFRPEVIYRASVAAAPMAAWVKATVDYSTILDSISPLNLQLQQLEKNQTVGEQQLHALKKKLKHIDAAVEDLRQEFSKKCKEAERLKDILAKAEKELSKACDLLEKLSGEKTRWAQDIEKIETNNRLLPKRALLSAAFMTYIAKETEDVRQRYFKKWSDRLNFPSVVTVTGFMRSESDLLQWKSEGLPRDDLSQENAIAMLDAVQTPLVIDPANQAIEWMRTHLQNNSVVTEITSVHDERFAHTLELAVRFGKTLLVVDVDGIEPILYPLLRRELLSTGAKRVVQVGSKQVDWQDTFRIMLFTRRTDLALPPGAAALVLEVNFSVTRFGLENQLLGVTIQHERPELEQQRVELLQREEKLKLELGKLEDRLLNDLASSHGNLLENVALVGALNDVKMQASSITEALQQSHSLQVELDEKRNVYRPFAGKGATIFFLVKDLEKMNRMYHFGLSDFIDLFVDCLHAYCGDSDVELKVKSLTLSFAQKCFFHVSVGLLKSDRLVFGMHLLQGFFPDEFPSPLWNVFIGVATATAGATSTNATGTNGGDLEFPAWAPATSRTKFSTIAADEQAAGEMQKWQLGDSGRWSKWMLEISPEESLAKDVSLTLMDQLLIIGTFRPDRLSDFMHHAVVKLLKLDTLVPVTSLEENLSHGKATTPLILITSRGADPSLEIQDIALRLVGKEHFTQIALGGGQTEDAMLHLRRSAAQGDWLFLKNLHLVLDWALILEKVLCAMPSPNPGFRLIITTEPHDLFPVVLLRMSSKVTIEAPPGVKQNLLQSYTTWDEAFLQGKTKTTSQVLFGLAWFHAVLQERRGYVPQGWVKFYEFSSTDLKSAADVLCTLSRDKVDWTTARGLLKECIYGGRLENSHDERVLERLVFRIFNDETLVFCEQTLYDDIHVPATNVHRAVVQFIREHLPDAESTSILSLPDNADRAVKEQVAVTLRENLRSFSQLAQVNASATETWRTLLAPVLELWTNTGLETQGSMAAVSAGGDTKNPMTVFFMSEVDLLLGIVSALAATFGELRCVVEGTLIPSLELRGEGTELIGGRVPARWLDLMDGPKDVQLWLALLRRRRDMMMEYAKLPFSPSSTSFDLMDFLRPQTFLNALRLHTVRVSNDALVELKLVAAPLGGVADGVGIGVLLKGRSIHLQGALLDAQGVVSLASATSPSSTPLACDLRAGWVSKRQTDGMVAQVPLYTNAERTTPIMDLSVRCDPDLAEKLLLGGVAAFLMSV